MPARRLEAAKRLVDMLAPGHGEMVRLVVRAARHDANEAEPTDMRGLPAISSGRPSEPLRSEERRSSRSSR